jgi:DNA-binding NarL/FixJ family response regulator
VTEEQQVGGSAPGVPVRVVIADDQPLIRAGFRAILDGRAGLEVVGEAADGAEAVELVRRQRPHVALLDVQMPRMDGIEAARRILGSGAEPATAVLMLTTFDLDEYVYDALQAGASGFLLKDVLPEQLIDAVRAVAAGDALIAPRVTRRLIERFATLAAPRPCPPELGELTARELEVLVLMARGRSNLDIARTLVVSDATVKTHVKHVLAKLRLANRVQAVVYAYEHGIVTPGERG